MKKVYRMSGLDCANCAAKMERAIGKIKGVTSAEISFMSQRLTLDADEVLLPDILEQVKKCVKKVDPYCEVLGI